MTALPRLFLFVCLTSLILVAQQPPRVGVGVIERKITLEESLETALKSNLEIEIERTNTANTRAALRAAKGAFDSILRWQPGIETRNTPTGSSLASATGLLAEHFHTENFYLIQKLPWNGLSFQVDLENGRQSTNNPFVGLNPYVTSRLALIFTQPLWRNRQIDADRSAILIRSKNVSVSDVDLELKVIDVATRVELAYWDLTAARQDVKVKADSVELAREQLAMNKRMIASGTLAPVEQAAAEAELERRLDDSYSSVGALTEAENAFKSLVAASRDEDIWGDVLIPAEERAADTPAADDLRDATALALQKRPELRQLAIRKEANDLQKAQAIDQTKPQFNLNAGYINNGLGGTVSTAVNPFTQSFLGIYQRVNDISAAAGLAPIPLPNSPPPASLVGGLGNALSGVFAGNYQTFQAGLAVEWNARNRAAEAAVSQTVIAERRLKLERAQLEQAISAQVRNALQAIRTARQRILAAEASSRAAKEKLDSETRLYQSGESTNFLVLTRQNEYVDSLRRVVVSRLDFNKAAARLNQAVGTTLERHNLRVP